MSTKRKRSVSRSKASRVNASRGPIVARRYDAAKIDRLTADWVFGPLSSNEEIKGGIETVRNRARELERNDPTARQYLGMVERNIVGRGFQLRIDGDEGGRVAKLFARWMTRADVASGMSGPDLQRLAIRTVARDGEVLCKLLRGSSHADGLGIQILEADYLDHNVNVATGPARTVMGVELDAMNRPTKYHLFDAHPGEFARGGFSGKRIICDAADVIHVFRRERPGQVRAVSWMASVMQAIRMLHGYQEAELVCARIASCKMGFYKIPPGEDFTPDGKDAETDAPLSDAAPGVFEQLPTGWEFQQFTPEHPTTQYGAFVKDVKRDIAGGLNVAYNNLANDLEGVSYSSIRSGTIEEREQWITLQDWFARAFLHPIYSEWLKMASLSGVITAADADRFAGADTWTGRRWPWVDPEKDLAAKEKEIALGLSSPSELAAEMAKDFQAIQLQIATDDETRDSNGLDKISSGKTASAAVSDTALNGAQIDSLVQIIKAAAVGEIPTAIVGPILAASFPSFDDAEIAKIVKPMSGFVAEPAPGK